MKRRYKLETLITRFEATSSFVGERNATSGDYAMKLVMQRVLMAQCLLLGLASGPAQARDGILSAIPADAIGFAVVHNLADASHSVGDLAKVVQAPALDLLSRAKGMSGLQKGLDEDGDVAIVLTSIDPVPKGVVLVPVANFADFFAALNVKEPTTGIVEVQLAGAPKLVVRKGDYAAFARAADRDALEQLLASTTNLATDASLAEWLAANKASVVVTSRGIQQLLPKFTSGIRAIQANFRQVPGEQGRSAADGLDLYVQLFAAAEPEVEQFGVGLRIDSAQTVDLVKRIQFTPGGAWAKWAADIKPAAEDFLAGLPGGPFVMALGAAVPPGATEHLMKFSVQFMQRQPMYHLTPEQAKKYVDLTVGAMHGVQSMRMLMGLAEPGAGLYGNMTALMRVDDSRRYLEDYEKMLVTMREFAQEVKSPAVPVMTSQRIRVGETEGLEISMELAQLKQITPPGGPDPEKMMQAMFGASGKMMIYLAPADEHTIVMAYTSAERLKTALEVYQSKQPGLSASAGVAKVAAALPAGSQVVAFANLSGLAKVGQQFAAMIHGAPAAVAIPDFPDSPPFGMAAKISPSGVEGHLVVTAEMLRVIGDAVAKARGAASGVSPPQQ